jgi:hypothetical protein
MEYNLNTLMLPTWDLGEIQCFCEQVTGKEPDKTAPREELLSTILQAKITPKLLEGAFAEGNEKLGLGVWCFNIPALYSCPGRSEECTRIMPDGHNPENAKPRCWAVRNAFGIPRNRVRYRLNHAWSKRPDFVEWAVEQIHAKRMQIVRWPSTGDFYNADYIDKVWEIVRRCPEVTFYGYTRSWSVPDSNIRLALIRLAHLPNYWMWWSLDHSMNPDRIPPGCGQICYLACDDSDSPPRDVAVGLVFRDQPGHEFGPDRTGKRAYIPMKTMGGCLVCPHENGIDKDKNDNDLNLTCSANGRPGNKGCGICWHGPEFRNTKLVHLFGEP